MAFLTERTSPGSTPASPRSARLSSPATSTMALLEWRLTSTVETFHGHVALHGPDALAVRSLQGLLSFI